MLEARDRIGGRVWVQRGALAGLDLDMGGAWVADCQPHVWSEADRYGVAREHDALPTSVRWRMGDAVVERSLPVDVEDLGELERAVAALLAAARRHDATRPPDAQGLEDLDVPAGAWIEALGLPRRVRELLLFWISACASAEPDDASLLEYLRWISGADHRLWAHLEAAVLGWRFPAGTAALYEAIAGDVRGEVALGDPVARDRGGRRRRARGDRRGRAAGAPRRRHRAGRRAGGDRLRSGAVGGEARGGGAEPRGAGREGLGARPRRPGRLLRDGLRHAARLPRRDGDDRRGRRAGRLRAVGGRARRRRPGGRARRGARARARGGGRSPSTPTTGSRDPYSRGTWAVLRPGQVHAAWSALRAPEGAVHFAGAHTALRWPSFMDGAVESGRRVAVEADAALG